MSAAPVPRRNSRCFQDAAGLPLTSGAARIMALAELEAQLRGYAVLGTQHVLISLIENDHGLTMAALSRAGARLPVVLSALNMAGAPTGQPPVGRPALGAEATAMLAAAGRLAQERGDECVVERDLLNAVLATSGAAARALAGLGIDPTDVREHAKQILAGQTP